MVSYSAESENDAVTQYVWVPLYGADLGGFGADTAREFLLRHLALGVFIPLMLGNEIMIALNEVPLFVYMLDVEHGFFAWRF